MDIHFEEGVLSPSATDMRPEPPNSLDLNGSHPRRIKLTAPNINLSLDQSEGSILSDDNLDSPDEIDINVDELDTPDEADSLNTLAMKIPWPTEALVKSQSLFQSIRLKKSEKTTGYGGRW